MNNSALNSGRTSPRMLSAQNAQLPSSRTSPFLSDANVKHAMDAPTFIPQNQQYRATNGTQQTYQNNTFASSTSPSSIYIRKLPLKTDEDTLRSMVVWSQDFVSAEVLASDKSEDAGFRSAFLHFKTPTAAQEAQRLLNGKPNISNSADMIVELFPSSPMTSRRFMTDGVPNGVFNSVSNTSSNTGPGSNNSSTSSGGSGGLTPRQESRYNGTFQNMEKISPTNNLTYQSNELPLPESDTHYTSLFSPQSPIGNHLTDPRTRVSGKALINNDLVDDDDTGELLKDAVAYAQNGAASQPRRATIPHIPTARMAGLSLNTSQSTLTSPATGYSGPTHMSAMQSSNTAMSPTMMSNGGPPIQYQMGNSMVNGMGSTMSNGMGNGGFPRHSFPPVNPADQNPPCNTLYVGNLPIDTSEDELKALFSKQRGYKRLCFRTKQNGPMCFVEFEDVSFATKALHELYGHPLHNSVKGGIRLSFSKNPLGVRSGQGMGVSGPPPPPGGMPSMNGMMNGSHAGGFSTASGPPPGLAAPPGLGPSRVQYGAVMNPMSQMNGQYNNGYMGNGMNNGNGWNGYNNGPMPNLMSQAATQNGANNQYPPSYMMGR